MGSGPTPLLTEVTIIAIGVWKVDLQTKVCEDFSIKGPFLLVESAY